MNRLSPFVALFVCSICLLIASSPVHAQESQPQPAAETAHADKAHAHGPKLGELISPVSVAPFALLLLCIAIFPLANPHWWEHNKNKGIIAAGLGVPVGLYLLGFGDAGTHALEHAAKEYGSFLMLLGSLFVISGGVYVRGSFRGTPLFNARLMALGACLASVIGTTGASMLLIRPLLRANEKRSRVKHVVVFFIFIVSNCGGLLTPLGDPPLFLGFLKGVPFEWTFRLLPQWAFVNGALLFVFFCWDALAFRAEATATSEAIEGEAPASREPFGIEGLHNFLGLVGIVAVIYCAGQAYGEAALKSVMPWGKAGEWPYGVQEGLMALIAFVCYCLTAKSVREKNRFGSGPIIEVAVLFAGIFATMIPALAMLNVHGESLGIKTPAQFFWASGMLSSFLDNAPTYLTFAVTACGIHGVNTEDGKYLAEFLALPPAAGAAQILAAISCGAVFMGANTYIGNGPNFMVKAIAEENNVKMPGFFGYMAYSCGILIPIFVAVTWVFFR